MTSKTFFLLTCGGLALCGCGGGGGGGMGGGIVSTPNPTPSPTPTPAPPAGEAAKFLAPPVATQEFAVSGAKVDLGGTAFLTGAADLPRVRYDASTNVYQVMMPGRDWSVVTDDPSSSGQSPNQSWRIDARAGMTNLTAPDMANADARYDYTTLAYFSDTSDTLAISTGTFAFAIPTLASAMPVTGSASFEGPIAGVTDEVIDWGSWGIFNAIIEGTINLAFDFSGGTLSGTLHPSVYGNNRVALPAMDFANTIYSTGSTSFSGTFTTALPGPNSFSGQFTGPAAEELMGGFRFPYVSPDDGRTYNAAGAFVAKR